MSLFVRLFRTKSVARIQADAASGLSDHETGSTLAKELTTFDLTALGIAAVIGAGIFQPSVMRPTAAARPYRCCSSSRPLPVVLRPCAMPSLPR